MSKIIGSRKGRLALLTMLVAGIAVSVALMREAHAAPYVNPFWANNSVSPESPVAMVASLALVREGERCNPSTGTILVDARTGELFFDHMLFKTPGLLEDNVFSLRWRSMISGSSQLGNGVVPSWEPTVQYVLLIPGSPNAPGGHRRDLRRPGGRIDPFTWNGAAYVAPTGVYDTMTLNGQGNPVVTDKWGGSETFDGLGMPAQKQDPNGNTWTPTYNPQYQIVGYVDDRSKSYT